MKKTLRFLVAATVLAALLVGCSGVGITAKDVKINGVFVDLSTGLPLTFADKKAAEEAVTLATFVHGAMDAPKPVKLVYYQEAKDGPVQVWYNFMVPAESTNVMVKAIITGYQTYYGKIATVDDNITLNSMAETHIIFDDGYTYNAGLIPATITYAMNPNAFKIRVYNKDTKAVLANVAVAFEAVEGQNLSEAFKTEAGNSTLKNYGPMMASSDVAIAVDSDSKVTHVPTLTTAVTDANGDITIPAGTLFNNFEYKMTFTLDGYYKYSIEGVKTKNMAYGNGTFNAVTADYNTATGNEWAYTVALDPVAAKMNAYAFKLKVRENDTDVALAGATVALSVYNAPFYTPITLTANTTDADGFVTIPANTVPVDGDLYAEVSKSGYITFKGDISNYTTAKETALHAYTIDKTAAGLDVQPATGADLVDTVDLEPTSSATAVAPKLVKISFYNNENVKGAGGLSVSYTFDKALTNLAPGVNNQAYNTVITQTGADFTATATTAGNLGSWTGYNAATTYNNDTGYEIGLSADKKTLTITVTGTIATTRTGNINFQVNWSAIGVICDGVSVYTAIDTAISTIAANVAYDDWNYDTFDGAAQ